MRPLGLGETLDACFKLVLTHFKALALVVIVVTIPVEIVNFFITTSTSGLEDGAITYSDEGAYVAGEVVANLLRVVAALLVTIGCFHILAEGYLGRSASAGESLKFAAKRSPKWIWTGLVLGVLLLLSLVSIVLLFIPTIWLIVASSLVFPVLLVEGLVGWKAIKRSIALVKDRWWATFGRLFIMYMIASLLASILGIVAIALLVANGDSIVIYAVATALSQLVSNVFTTPLIAAITVIVYFDLRVRKEGFDLALLAEQMGGGQAAPSPFAQGGAVPTPASTPIPAPAPAPAPEGEEFGGFAPPAAPPQSPERPGW